MARRYAPVRPIATSAWSLSDKLSRGLSKTVAQARREQRRLNSSPDLAERFRELRGAAEGNDRTAELPQALAVAAAACHRLAGSSWEVCGEEMTWELLPRDNQLACAAVLARGDVAELDTGEGKTLCAALAAACWALSGRVHVVTANDYLARRDFDWMGPLLRSLGLEVGLVHHETPTEERQGAYRGDVVYVSIKEIGADYLRDTLTSERTQLLLPGLETAILDEIDFILVDEARIPLILAQPSDAKENLCHQFNETIAGIVGEQGDIKERIRRELEEISQRKDWSVKKRRFESTVRLAKLLLADPLDAHLQRSFTAAIETGDNAVVRRVKRTITRFEKTHRLEELLENLLYMVDRKVLAVKVTEYGLDRLQRAFGDLFDPPEDSEEELAAHHERLKAVHNLLAAHVLYRKDRDYIIEDGKVVLIDQSTGRPSYDRHLQHGLHRALEAKEGLYPALDHRTAAEITFPGLFQLYRRFSGTSGTCLELEPELHSRLRKKVIRIPPHRPIIRVDLDDVVFRTADEKVRALIAEVVLSRRLRQPVLIGTSSVEQSEWVSTHLTEHRVPHQVLNARHHEAEARIIARAGEPATVTVATTMAGRGTDIRPAPKLAEGIAEAAAQWVSERLGTESLRIQVFSQLERELLSGALQRAGVGFRYFRRKRSSTIIDVGPNPPPTAFPLSLGLRIIGFERLGANRLDRQLRGRTGRQGAPGCTRFYLSLDDETSLVFGDRARLGELTRKSRPRIDALSHEVVRSGRRLADEVKRAWSTLESLNQRQRERLSALDSVDQEQRVHYDAEREALLHARDETISRLADNALERAALDICKEIMGEEGHLDGSREVKLDDLTEILFERRGLARGLIERGYSPKSELVAEALGRDLREIYDVAREAHGRDAMARVERTVLLDALTESWRKCSAERPELREQAELYAYANHKPAVVYRHLAGQTYHHALDQAARSAASVLVTFPLPREIKTPRTGQLVESGDVRSLFATTSGSNGPDSNRFGSA